VECRRTDAAGRLRELNEVPSTPIPTRVRAIFQVSTRRPSLPAWACRFVFAAGPLSGVRSTASLAAQEQGSPIVPLWRALLAWKAAGLPTKSETTP